MNIPVIVDMLDELQVVVHPVEVQVVGKFSQPTASLSYQLAMTRAETVVEEIKKMGTPLPLTIYINENWQAFAISAAVSSVLGVVPRILLMKSNGEIVDLFNFYIKGGETKEVWSVGNTVMQVNKITH